MKSYSLYHTKMLVRRYVRFCINCLEVKNWDIEKKWKMCDRCMFIEYCDDCIVEHENKNYCLNCIRKCECCESYSTDPEMPLCDKCFSYAIEEVRMSLVDESEYKRILPQYCTNVKMVLRWPLLDRPVIRTFLKYSSWSFICDD